MYAHLNYELEGNEARGGHDLGRILQELNQRLNEDFSHLLEVLAHILREESDDKGGKHW